MPLFSCPTCEDVVEFLGEPPTDPECKDCGTALDPFELEATAEPPKVPTDPADRRLIRRIAVRAFTTAQAVKLNRIDIEKDIAVTHANGCPLQLGALLAASDFDFFTDVLGIHRHLDRATGKLDTGFRPRFARRTDRQAA